MQVFIHSVYHQVLTEDEEQFEVTESLITGIASCAEKAASVNSVHVSMAMGLSTTHDHGNQKRTYRVARQRLAIS